MYCLLLLFSSIVHIFPLLSSFSMSIITIFHLPALYLISHAMSRPSFQPTSDIQDDKIFQSDSCTDSTTFISK
jgi:hypothetical protein